MSSIVRGEHPHAERCGPSRAVRRRPRARVRCRGGGRSRRRPRRARRDVRAGARRDGPRRRSASRRPRTARRSLPRPSRRARPAPSRCASACSTRTGRRCARGFEVEAQRRLHLIVVRRDLTGYQHLHPAMARRRHLERAADGRAAGRLPRLRRLPAHAARSTCWPPICSPRASSGRQALPAPARDRAHGRLRRPARAARAACGPRGGTRASPSAAADGPCREIQPYLGARGHLVALRQGDLAYLHVHPEDARRRRRRDPVRGRLPLARAPTACSCSSRSTASSTPRRFTVEVTP